MVSDADVINGKSTDEVPEEPPVAHTAEPATAGPVCEDAPSEPGAAAVSSRVTPARRRVWSTPKAPVTREQADEFGRVAAKVGASVVTFAASVARGIERIVHWGWHAVEEVPPALRVLFVTGLLVLLSVVGSVALDNSLGRTCAVVFVPLCSITLGVIGHRWYSGLTDDSPQYMDAQAADHATSELKRSVTYLDNKLTFALNSLGTEHHQQAVIALFQAKTAVELALGTEQSTTSEVDGLLAPGDQDMRPRIRAGSASKLSLRETNSLAAS